MIRGFIAASLDGYIADATEGVDWLKPFETVETGYDAFYAAIGTVILGRVTYDQVLSFGVGWPYAGKRAFVVTSRPLEDAPPGVSAWGEGVEALIAHLRSGAGLAEDGGRDAWVVGGARLQAAFIAAGGLDRLDLFLMPVLLGDGVPLFPKKRIRPRSMVLRHAQGLDKGVVRLTYDLTEAGLGDQREASGP